MNDNRDSATGFQIHLPAYFYVNEGRQVTIQIPDRCSFLHVTVYRFYAS